MRVALRDMAGRDGIVRLHRAGDGPLAEPRMHSHDELECNLVVRGHADVLFEHRRYRLGPDGIAWLFPHQEHLLIDQSPDFAMWVLVFAPRFARASLRGDERVLLDANPPGVFHRRIETRERRDLDRLCRELAHAELPAHHRTPGLRWLLLSAWRAFTRAVVVADQAQLDEAVAVTVRRLERGDDDDDLASLAAAAAVSPSWLSRRFKLQIGLSLVEYRSRQRLRRFFDLLEEDPGAELTATAYAAGFTSYDQFNRIFHRFVGMAPRDWRATR